MIEKGQILTGSDAQLSSRGLPEVKTKFYEESEAQLDDTQANDGQDTRHSYFSPLRKHLVLGTIIARQAGAEGRSA